MFKNLFVATAVGLGLAAAFSNGASAQSMDDRSYERRLNDASIHGFYTHADDDSGSVQLTHTQNNPGKWYQDQTYALLVSKEGAYIDGISLDYDWNDIETAPGTTNAASGVTCPPAPNTQNCFDFSYFDGQLKALSELNQAYGRSYKAILAITPSPFPGQPAYQTVGVQLPPWLFEQKGAMQFHTITNGYNPLSGIYMANACLPLTIPVPWDPVFQREYKDLIHAFANFTNKESEKYPGMIAAVKMIPLAYMNENTQLPASMPSASITSCQNNHRPSGFYAKGYPVEAVPNDVENWMKIGYTPDKLMSAYSQLVSYYNTEFPNLPLELSVTGNALEPIDNTGIITDAQGVNIHTSYSAPTMLVQEASRIIGNRLNVSFHSLVGYHPNGFFAYLDGLGNGKINLGYGDGWPVSNDASCVMTGGFPSFPECILSWAMRETFLQAQIGGANYMILDLGDLQKYKRFLKYAHDWILTFPGSRSMMLSPIQQHLDRTPWVAENASVVPAPDNVTAPDIGPAGAADRNAPPVQMLQESPRLSRHGLMTQFHLEHGNYAFTIFAAPATYDNRWVKITSDAGTPHESSGLFYLESKVEDSAPTPVNPVNGVGGLHAAEMSCLQTNNRWCQLTIHVFTPGGMTHLDIQLVDPPQGNKPAQLAYTGSPQSGVYFWGAQVVPMLPETGTPIEDDN